MSEIPTLKSHASGRWISILHALAPQLSQACEHLGQHVPCPVHGGTDGFRLFKDVEQTGGGICNTCGAFADGFALLEWVTGWTFPEAKDAVKHFLGIGEGYNPPKRITPKPLPEKDWTVERQRLQIIWEATIPDNGRIKEYLDSRGLTVEVPPTLRLHPSLGSYNEGLEGYFQAMVARI